MGRTARLRLLFALLPSLFACGTTPLGDPADAGERPLTCYDDTQNGDETDTDCGGPCIQCGAGRACRAGTDCDSGFCTNLVCDEATCSDGARNSAETDIDCGGFHCSTCPVGKACLQGRDCLSQTCTNNVCTGPPCEDGQRSGTETDVDCGGPTCSPCATGLACLSGSDCASGTCRNNRCVALGDAGSPAMDLSPPPDLGFGFVHHDGEGNTWFDDVPTGTHNVQQATRACQTYIDATRGGLGSCDPVNCNCSNPLCVRETGSGRTWWYTDVLKGQENLHCCSCSSNLWD